MPTLIERYRPEGLLGVGPMGKVFTATDSQTGLKVAFRAFARQEGTSDADWAASIQSMSTHLRTAQKLDHPRLAKIYDFGEEGDYFVVVSEWFDGEALRLKLDRGERYPVDIALEMVGHVGRVLEYAAEEGVIHGDVTPFNLIVTRAGSIHVVNYGLGILRPRALSLYRAPEQVRGTGEDARSDMFALGLVFYEMVTGRHPFAAETPEESHRRILSDPPPPLPEASSDFQQIFARLLDKHPEKRYASWAEVAVDIAAWRHKQAGSLPRFATENIDPRETERIEAAKAAAQEKLAQLDEIRRDRAEKEKRKARSAIAWARAEKAVRWSFVSLLALILVHAGLRRWNEHSLKLAEMKGEVLLARGAAAPEEDEDKKDKKGKKGSGEDRKPVGGQPGQKLEVGDLITTGAGGTARLAVGDGSQVLLGPNSTLAVREVGFRPRDSQRVRAFTLTRGVLHALVRKRPRQEFLVATPIGKVVAKGTQFSVTITGSKTFASQTLEGSTEVSNTLGKKTVPAGTQVFVQPSERIAEPVQIPPEVRKQAEAALESLLKSIPQGVLAALDGLDDTVFTPVADIAQGLAGHLSGASDTALQQGGAVAKAQGAMQALVQAMEASMSTEGAEGYPQNLDLKTLAQISPSAELKTQILGQFKGEKLEFYRPLKDGYEMGARARDSAGTLIVARNGKVTIKKEE